MDYTYKGRLVFFTENFDGCDGHWVATLDAPEFVCWPEDPAGWGMSKDEAMSDLLRSVALEEVLEST